jgi:hypothetical protein
MTNLFAFLGLAGPSGIIIALLVVAALSQRLGAVTRRTPLYRWFYVSAVAVGLGLVLRLLDIFLPEQINLIANPLYYDVPLLVGLIIAVVIAWRYWSWLLSERGNK